MPIITDTHRTQLSESGNLAECIASATLASTGDKLDILLDVPGGVDIGITGATYACFGGSVSVSLYIAPTVTVNGSAAGCSFYDLTANKTPQLGVYTDPTLSDAGTLGGSFKVWGTTATAGKATSVVSREVVRKLNRGTKYLIRIESLNNNVDVQAFIEWKEI